MSLKSITVRGRSKQLYLVIAAQEFSKREPRFRLHNIILRRGEVGEFFNLFPNLVRDEPKKLNRPSGQRRSLL